MTENIRKVESKQFNHGFRFHVLLFLILNGMLLVINVMFSPSYYWVLYPFFGWFIAICVHLSLQLKISKPQKQTLLVHIVLFLSTNLLLLMINYYNGNTINWAFFPFFFWGIGVVLHAVVYKEYLASLPVLTPEEKKIKRANSPPKKIGDKLESLKKRARLIQASDQTIPDQEKTQEVPLKSVNISQNVSMPVKAKKKVVKEELIDLSEVEEAELKKTEAEMGIEEKKITCLVHKGPIEGTVYVCPKCKTHYCLTCVNALKQKGEKCWACDSELKP